jgi:nitrogenase molybdenum-iron protein alpha/beta subunit
LLASPPTPQPTPPSFAPSGKNLANALLVEAWHNKNDTVKFPLIVGALEKKGVQIRRLSAGASLDDFLDAPNAALNLVLNAVSQPLAAKMEASFRVPYAPLHNTFAVANVDAAYGMIAETFGFKWGGEFDAWRDMALALEKRARVELPGLKYAMLPGVDMPAALAAYLAGFGMEPLIIAIEDFHGEDAGYARQLKTLGYDPPICRMMNIDYDIEIVRGIKPDISFGALPDPIEGFRCAEEMGDFYGITGYERTAGILSRIFTLLETGGIGERIDMYGAAPL